MPNALYVLVSIAFCGDIVRSEIIEHGKWKARPGGRLSSSRQTLSEQNAAQHAWLLRAPITGAARASSLNSAFVIFDDGDPTVDSHFLLNQTGVAQSGSWGALRRRRTN